ncbi:MAG: PEP/pyruvate-binding domain-containing protein, partial [bacterium]
MSEQAQAYIIPLDRVGMGDVVEVGGKNASLGEMIQALSGLGVQVPGGFATTSCAFRDFLDSNGLTDPIYARLSALDVADVTALQQAGAEIRQKVLDAPFQPALEQSIESAFEAMQLDPRDSVAVRSSATAEDLP